MKLTWQEEINKRVAVFFGGAVLAGAFGGIFGYALSRMAGVGGLNGWQWIFIMEGMFPEVACRQQTDIQGSSRWLSELPHSGWCKIGPIKLNSSLPSSANLSCPGWRGNKVLLEKLHSAGDIWNRLLEIGKCGVWWLCILVLGSLFIRESAEVDAPFGAETRKEDHYIY
jgi:hypothetical protein